MGSDSTRAVEYSFTARAPWKTSPLKRDHGVVKKENHIMRTKILAVSTLVTVIFSGVAFAQAPKADEDHSAHHPTGSVPAASAPAPSPGATPSPEAFDRQMKAMQDMHQRMQAAKTPAERAKLMDDHMRIMRSGMAMMSQMHGGTSSMAGMSGMRSSTSEGMGGMMNMHMQMERRMAMMEQMMQMMIDREAGVPRR